MNIPTYDNSKFHFVLFIFFGAGALLNGEYGYLSGKPSYYFNAILLAVMSICTYRLFGLYSKGSKR